MAAKAAGIAAQMEIFATVYSVCGLHVSKLVFSATEQAASVLQGKDITAAEAGDIITSLRKYMHEIRASFDTFWTDVL